MPILSEIVRRKKIEYFLDTIPDTSKVLEIGSGDGWVSEYFRNRYHDNYSCIDLNSPADIIGDIRDWKKLGLNENSFDVIIAFEVVEHVDCFKECHDLLVPGGRLLLTSPLPCMDPVMKLLEIIGLNQKRTSPHSNLVYFKDVGHFNRMEIKTFGFLSQWGVFTK